MSKNTSLDMSQGAIKMRLTKTNGTEFFIHLLDSIKGEISICEFIRDPGTFLLPGERDMKALRKEVTDLGTKEYAKGCELKRAEALLKTQNDDFIPSVEEIQKAASLPSPMFFTPQKFKKREKLDIMEIASHETKVQLLERSEKTMKDSSKPDIIRQQAANDYEKIKFSVENPELAERTNLESIIHMHDKCITLTEEHGTLKMRKEIASSELANYTALYNIQKAIYVKEVAIIFNALLDDGQDGLIDTNFRHQLHYNKTIWDQLLKWQTNRDLIEFLNFLKTSSSKTGMMDVLQKVINILNVTPPSNTPLSTWIDEYMKLVTLLGTSSEEIKNLILINFHDKIIKYYNYSTIPGGNGILQAFLQPWLRLDDDLEKQTFPRTIVLYIDKLDRYVTSYLEAARSNSNADMPNLVSKVRGSKTNVMAALQNSKTFRPATAPSNRVLNCKLCQRDSHLWFTCKLLNHEELAILRKLFESANARLNPEKAKKSDVSPQLNLKNNAKPMHIKGKVQSLVRERASKSANNSERDTSTPMSFAPIHKLSERQNLEKTFDTNSDVGSDEGYDPMLGSIIENWNTYPDTSKWKKKNTFNFNSHLLVNNLDEVSDDDRDEYYEDAQSNTQSSFIVSSCVNCDSNYDNMVEHDNTDTIINTAESEDITNNHITLAKDLALSFNQSQTETDNQCVTDCLSFECVKSALTQEYNALIYYSVIALVPVEPTSDSDDEDIELPTLVEKNYHDESGIVSYIFSSNIISSQHSNTDDSDSSQSSARSSTDSDVDAITSKINSVTRMVNNILKRLAYLSEPISDAEHTLHNLVSRRETLQICLVDCESHMKALLDFRDGNVNTLKLYEYRQYFEQFNRGEADLVDPDPYAANEDPREFRSEDTVDLNPGNNMSVCSMKGWFRKYHPELMDKLLLKLENGEFCWDEFECPFYHFWINQNDYYATLGPYPYLYLSLITPGLEYVGTSDDSLRKYANAINQKVMSARIKKDLASLKRQTQCIDYSSQVKRPYNLFLLNLCKTCYGSSLSPRQWMYLQNAYPHAWVNENEFRIVHHERMPLLTHDPLSTLMLFDYRDFMTRRSNNSSITMDRRSDGEGVTMIINYGSKLSRYVLWKIPTHITSHFYKQCSRTCIYKRVYNYCYWCDSLQGPAKYIHYYNTFAMYLFHKYTSLSTTDE